MANNKKIGNDFESELCRTLYNHGFWAYNTVNKTGGQPADIIAARNDVPYLIDAKVCTNDEFPTKRIEENQKNSMLLFDRCGNKRHDFALKLSDGSVYMCDGLTLLMIRQEKKTLKRTDIMQIGIPLDKWIARCP